MKKENKAIDETTEATTETNETAVNPVVDVLKSISNMSQVNRLVLYSRLDVIINHDREKASHGADGGTHLFEEAINSL